MAKKMRKGASYVPGDRFASVKAGQQCRVLLLDGTECLVDVDKKSLAQVVFDHILRKLEILERDYFALRYEDEDKIEQWIDLHKPLKKQLKKPPFQVMFRVRYYARNPGALHSSSRNQFYLQLRLDITEGRLILPLSNTPTVLSYVLQADTGDYESEEKDSEYLTNLTLVQSQSEEVESEVARFHQLHSGMNPKEAVNRFLKKAGEVESYGTHYWSVRYEGMSYQLGMSPAGLAIYKDTKKIYLYPWSCVVQLSYKSKKFTLKLRGHKGDPAEGISMGLELESSKACKEAWKTTIDDISFYTDANRKTPEFDSTGSWSTPTSPTSPQFDGVVFHPSGSPVHPKPVRDLRQPEPAKPLQTSDKPLTKAQKVKSLPRHLPSSSDPILMALKKYKSKDQTPSGYFSDPSSPTSPDDVLSTSTSEGASSPRHGEYRSPLSGEKELHPRDGEDVAAHRAMVARGEGARQLEKPSPGSRQRRQNESDAHDYDYPPSSSPSTAPASSTDLDAQEKQTHDDMHDSLLDLADALGGSGSSVEHHSDDKEEDIDIPLSGTETEGTTRLEHSSESAKASHPTSPEHEDLSQPTSSILDSLDENSPLPPLPGTEGDSPPPKPPRVIQSVYQSPSPTQASQQLSHQDKKKQSRHVLRNWAQEHQLRSFHSPQPPTSPSPQPQGSPGRPSSELRSPTVRSPEPISPSPLTVHCSIAPTERSSGSRPNTAGSSRSTRSSGSTGSLPPTATTAPSIQPSYHSSRSQTSRANRTVDEESRSRELDRSKELKHKDLPLSPPPPPYMSPSPDSEHAQLLRQLQPRERSATTTETINSLDSPDLSSVDDILISLGVPPTNSASQSPTATHAPREASFRSKSPDLVHEFEQAVGTQPSLKDASRHKQVSGPSPKRTRERLFSDPPVHSSTQARHQRRGMERQFRKSQKQFQQVLSNGGGVELDDELTGGSSSLDTVARSLPSGVGDPGNYFREGMEIDPRNLIDAPSPVYDRLENLSSSTGVSTSGQHAEFVAQEPYYATPEGGDDVSNLLDELVMSSEDLPPPPPHLVALSQELGLEEQVPVPRQFSEPKLQPPQSNGAPHTAITSTATGGSRYPKRDFDPKFFVKSVKMDRPTDRSTGAPDPSRYPPEIASFITRVRNLSVDADSPPSHEASIHEEEEEEEEEEEMNPSNLFDQTTPTAKRRQPTGETRPHSSIEATERVRQQEGNVQRHRSNEFYGSNRPGPDTPAGFSQSGSSPAQRKQDYEREGPKGLSPARRHRDVAMSWDASEQHRQGTTPEGSPSRQKHNLGQSWDTHTHNAARRSKVTPEGSPNKLRHEFDPKRNSFGPSTPDLRYGHQRREMQASPGKTRHELGRSWTDDAAQANWDYRLQQPSMKSFSLPRGQGSPRLNRYRQDDSSRESTPSIPQTHSDLAPAHHQPHEQHSYPNPQSYPGRYDPRSHDLDVQRAGSFNSRLEPAFVAPQYNRHHLEEDSLPSSPTFFTHNPPDRDESTPSPSTQATNVSFQEHLNALDTGRKGRKSRVMDWFNKTSDVWSYDSRFPMTRDPNSDRPAMPYARQSPVYATAEEILEGRLERQAPPPHQPQQTQQAPSQPNYSQDWQRPKQAPPQQWQPPPPQQIPPQQWQQPHQQNQLQQRQPPPPQQIPVQQWQQPHQQNQSQQRQPPPPQQIPPQQWQRSQQAPSQYYPPVSRPPENGAYHSHTYAGRGQPKPVQYPKATFTKDYYVIDV